MEYRNTSEVSDNERKLCSGCQTFFGTKATNFMCSQCFKKADVSSTVTSEQPRDIVKQQMAQNVGNESILANRVPQTMTDVEIEPEILKKPEEMKEKEVVSSKPKVSILSSLPITNFTAELISSPANSHILL